ncbi:MAG: cupin domain-containing protein [Chloroflexi bacterium]|nr:cupin domain-containing protein [Chloroflexota bacterium]
MTFFTVDELPATEMLPGITRRAVYLDHVMITFLNLQPGSTVPEHSHPHEQITYVVSGGMEFYLGDEKRVLHAGSGACCPPGVSHRVVVLDEPTVALDAWYPPREEYK